MDISPFNIIFGVERIGKSTLSRNLFYRYYLFREIEYLLEILPDPLERHDYFDKYLSDKLKAQSISFLADFEKYKITIRDLFINDEGIVTSDRRDAMRSANIKQLKTLNVYAENDNTLLSLTQYLSDLESRLVKRANFLTLVYKKGSALVFMPQKNLSFINQVSTIEKIKEDPDILYKPNAIRNLKKFRDYMVTLTYHPLPKSWLIEKASREIKDELKSKLITTS